MKKNHFLALVLALLSLISYIVIHNNKMKFLLKI